MVHINLRMTFLCIHIIKMKIKTQGQSTPTTVVKMDEDIVQSLNNMNQWSFHMVLISNLVVGEADQCLVRLSIWPNWSLSEGQDDQYVDRIFIWSNWSERPGWPIQTKTAADLKCSVSLSTGSARLFGSSFFKYLFLQIQSFKSLYLLNWSNWSFLYAGRFCMKYLSSLWKDPIYAPWTEKVDQGWVGLVNDAPDLVTH